MTRLRVVIAGISHWHSPRYLAALARHDVMLAGVSDHDPAVATRRAGELACEGYATTPEMLEGAKPDFAIVLPRHDLALREITAIADRKVAALIEKPMGLDAREAKAAAAMVSRAGTFAAACLPNRHLRFWEAIAALRDEGRLGRPLHASFRLINGPAQRYRDQGVGWMLDPALSGGGALRNLGAHTTDAARTLASMPLSVRSAVLGKGDQHLPVEAHAVALLAADDGFVVTVEAGYTHANPTRGDQEFRLAATGAYVVDANGVLTVATADGETTEPSRRAAEVYDLMVDEALRRFRSGMPPVASLAECAEAVELIDEIYRCAAVNDRGAHEQDVRGLEARQ